MPRRELPMAAGDEHSCLLSASDLQVRIDRWRALTSRALRSTREPGRVRSVFPRDEQITQTLRSLIAAEAECCSFLSFDVSEQAHGIEVELRYPAGFDPSVIFTGTDPG